MSDQPSNTTNTTATAVHATKLPRRQPSKDSRPKHQIPLMGFGHAGEQGSSSGRRPKKPPLILALSPRAAKEQQPSSDGKREKEPSSLDRHRGFFPNARLRPIGQGLNKQPSETNQVRNKGSIGGTPKATTPSCENLRKMPSSTGDKDPNDLLMELCGKSLINYNWYHGLMPRLEVESLLEKDGDFIVRRTTLKKSSLYCITVMHGEPRHFPLQYRDGSWTLCGLSAGTLPELIDTLQKDKHVLTNKAVLKHPIPRPEYYLLHENISMENKVGGGAFGEVYNGKLKLNLNTEPIAVAVKVIKGQVQKTKVAEFIKEAKLMRRFNHQNCVRLHGVAPQEEPLMIVLELCPKGSLKSWFKNTTVKVTREQLYNFMKDAGRGMCYLSLCNVIHRDLAARNCLLGADLTLKISDFGLSVAGQSELVLERLKSVPIRWLSPETLSKGVFNTKTDVWSYGVLVWEIFSHCKTDPFPNKTNAEAKDIILGPDAPMSAPPESPEIVPKIMHACFEKNASKRADFVEILKMVAPGEIIPSAAVVPD